MFITVCMYVCIHTHTHTLQLCIIDLTQRGCHILRVVIACHRTYLSLVGRVCVCVCVCALCVCVCVFYTTLSVAMGIWRHFSVVLLPCYTAGSWSSIVVANRSGRASEIESRDEQTRETELYPRQLKWEVGRG